MEVLKHRNATVVTPIVKSIGDKLFHGLSAAGNRELEVVEDYTLQERHRMHRGNPASIRWGCQPDENGLYEQVIIDGVTYAVRPPCHFLPIMESILICHAKGRRLSGCLTWGRRRQNPSRESPFKQSSNTKHSWKYNVVGQLENTSHPYSANRSA